MGQRNHTAKDTIYQRLGVGQDGRRMLLLRCDEALRIGEPPFYRIRNTLDCRSQTLEEETNRNTLDVSPACCRYELEGLL